MDRPLRLARGAALTAIGATFLALVALLRFAIDQACIDARYAGNLARGLGPRFNAADPPLEAWDSPALTALGAAAELVGLDALGAMQVAGALCGLALMGSVYSTLTGNFAVRASIALAAVATLGLSPLLAAWSTGLPSTLPAALLTWFLFERAALAPAKERATATGALLAAAGLLLTRQDGLATVLLVGAVAIGWRWFEHRRAHRPLPRSARPPATEELRAPLLALVGALGLAGVLSAARLVVFDDPIPWAVRRVDPPDLWSGAQYLLATTVGTGLPMVWVASALHPSGRRGAGFAAAAVLGLLAARVVLSGGESEPFARLLVPLAPFGSVAIALWADHAATRGRWGAATSLLGVALLLAQLPAWDVPLAPRPVRQVVDLRPDTARTRTEISHWRFVRANTQEGLALGRVVRAIVGPDATWTVGHPGARGLGSDLHLYDLSGAVSPAAHALRHARPDRADFPPGGPTVLRARSLDSEAAARVVAADWEALDPEWQCHVAQVDGVWVVVQVRRGHPVSL